MSFILILISSEDSSKDESNFLTKEMNKKTFETSAKVKLRNKSIIFQGLKTGKKRMASSRSFRENRQKFGV